MGGPSSVCINDDLAAGEAGIGSRSTNVELSARVDDVLGVLSLEFYGDDLFADFSNEGFFDLLVGNGGIMLSRDKDIVDLGRLEFASILRILNDNL